MNSCIPYWAVAMCKAQSEHIAQYNLERQNFECYLPKFLEGKGKLARVKVLFPRYIFVRIHLQWHSINGTRGITRLILNELTPAKISDRIISDLKSKEDKKGYIILPESSKFQVNDTVRVVKGPLSDYIGIYKDTRPNDRVRILIQLLGQEVPVELDEKDLVLAASNDAAVAMENNESDTKGEVKS